LHSRSRANADLIHIFFFFALLSCNNLQVEAVNKTDGSVTQVYFWPVNPLDYQPGD
jgi:hypothetical protein